MALTPIPAWSISWVGVQSANGWAVPLTVLVVLGVPTIACGLSAARERYASHEMSVAD
jgi:cyanate permease